MTTPVAERSATTVVPCGMSPVIGWSIPAPGSRCGATLRSRSANDGPGSVVGVKRGKDSESGIGAGAYRRVSAAKRLHTLPHHRRQFLITIEIVGSLLREVEALAQVAERVVATEAQ